MSVTGRHKAQCVDYAMGVTKNGKQQIELVLAIVGGDSDGETVNAFKSFEGGARAYTMASMKKLGWDGTANLETLKLNTVTIQVTEEQRGDDPSKTSLDVRIFAAGLMTPTENRMRPNEIARTLGIAAPASKPQPKPQRQPGDDDDLAF